MIIDKRTYTYHPAQFGTFLKAYAALGFPLTTKHLGTTLAIMTSASGVANQTVQFFAYEDHDHRDRCRAGLLSDPAWLDFVRLVGPFIRKQENMILAPTASSPLRDVAGVSALKEATARRIGSVGKSMVFAWVELACLPGSLPSAIKLIDDEGAALLDRHIGQPIGRFTAQTGNLDSLFVLTGHTTLADRAARRRALHADPDYPSLIQRLWPLLHRREATLLSPTVYSPLR